MQVQHNIPALYVTNRDYEGTKESLINEYSQLKPALFDKMVTAGDHIYLTKAVPPRHHPRGKQAQTYRRVSKNKIHQESSVVHPNKSRWPCG